MPLGARSRRALLALARLRERATLAGVTQALDIARAYLLFRNTEHGAKIVASGHVRVVAGGRIVIGNNALFTGGMIPTELLCHEGATLTIGDGADFNYGVSLEAWSSIRIGARSMFGSRVRISDTNKDGTLPIVIGDDVWVAHGAVIEPGVTIGDGSVISAGSVVTYDIPKGSLAMGNPARPLPISIAR